jgi:hypothetical protein
MFNNPTWGPLLIFIFALLGTGVGILGMGKLVTAVANVIFH